jgi:RHS repeat-associated protein
MALYVWGLDLSGSLQGAGGVGGLLWTFQPQVGNSRAFVCYDGNGNVSSLVYFSNGSVVGQYEYGPFGEVLRASGPMAKANPFRFSTKYQDDETDLLYYGFRYYNAGTGRWNSRDPLNSLTDTDARYELLRSCGQTKEAAWGMVERLDEPTEYVMARNSPDTLYDLLGLCVPLPDSGPGDFHSNFWNS